jgi:hypothetical protein
MKKTKEWVTLALFGEQSTGEKADTPAVTERAEETGDRTAAPAAGEQETEKTRQTAFRALMEGEYKDLFTAYFQETFNRRFKEQKGMMEELGRARAVVAAAARRYGTSDEEALLAALEKEHEIAADHTDAPKSEEFDTEAMQSAIDAAVLAAREETERAVLAGIRARGLRPAESGATAGRGIRFDNAAARLSRADRADMARRAAKGERIKL